VFVTRGNALIEIRTATSDDVDVVYDFILAIAHFHEQRHLVETTKEEIRQSGFGADPKFGVLLAEVEGETAGYCTYTWNYSIWRGVSYMNLDDLFVWDKFRSQKIGLHLMHKLREVCVAGGANRIRWEVEKDNTHAIGFYNKLGAQVDIKGTCRWDV
jgi:GNAT superfamily N-acetyltransferase